MRITPLDIRKQPFRKTFRGFDPDEVNSFLEMVAAEFETIITQNNEMATNIKVVEEKLSGYIKIEKTLNDTLITAQKISDDARANAQKEAELIIRDAQIRADRYEDESRNRVHTLQSEMAALKNQRDSFLARFGSMLKTQLNLLGVLSGDLLESSELTAPQAPQREQEETLAEVSSDILSMDT